MQENPKRIIAEFDGNQVARRFLLCGLAVQFVRIALTFPDSHFLTGTKSC